MINYARTNQGGSVVTFLVVGAVLVAVTLGGVYFVQQRGSAPVATPPSPSPSSSPSVSQSTAPSASPRPSTSASPRPSASPAPTSHPTTGTAPTTHLPETGPADDLVLAIIPTALLVGAAVSYIQSRRTHYSN